MSREIVEKELRKVDDSFAKVEGFLTAAIDELFPSHTAYGPIEGMLVYQKPDPYSTDASAVRNGIADARSQARELVASLRDMKSDMRAIYMKEFEDGKDTD